MKRLPLPLGVLALGALTLLLAQQSLNGQVPEPKLQGKQVPVPQVPGGAKGGPNLELAIGKQAPTAPVGDPVAFTSKEGKKGWKVVIPGNRPLATPAVVNGKIFIGGGFGSHEFYAFDAQTGKKLWLYRTGDDGPTAAVVQDGYIAFNTESCELEIITMDGKRVWKKWLGDPLMSMPAIDQGKVYMCFPDSKGDHHHHLACFDLKDGKEYWRKAIAGEIITAPVIQSNKLYLSTLEGTLYCFDQEDGKLVWKEKKNASSSPTVWNGKCYFSRREAVTVKNKEGKDVKQQTEQIAGREVIAKGKTSDLKETAQVAEYLDFEQRKLASPKVAGESKQDAAVGFATAPAAAKLMQARDNLGVYSVCGVWAYQGSRPFIYNNLLFSAMGDNVKCVDPKTEKVLWKKDLHTPKDKKKPLVDSMVTPPALVNGKIFLGTGQGEVICLSAADGKELWRATVGEPIAFQPAVANGRVYVSTSTGHLYCLETGDANDDGWLMWGGNAAHNGLVR
jgi:Ca-activated chloride channel family protein